MLAIEIIFWVSVGLLIYAQVGYGLLLAALASFVKHPELEELQELPTVALIIAAHNEEAVIGEKVNNALTLDYPPALLEVIVASDGSTDATVARAKNAGADRVLELPRGGKIRAQDEAVRATDAQIVAFSDANSTWQEGALKKLVARFAEEKVGYVCGQVKFVNEGGTNQEGLYWRYEMWQRQRESELASITAGNGAIYATRASSYIEVDPVMGHDLSFPFNMVKRGWRAVYEPTARATEKMVPSIEGEFARKRRMMTHTWPIVLRGGLLRPKGYSALYALMVFSHRVLRYKSPFLHILAFVLNLVLLGQGSIYIATLCVQLGLLLAAGPAGVVPIRPFLVARYYVLTTAAIALGFWDWLRHGTEATWEAPEGTR